MEVGPVPASEGVGDGVRQLGEGVTPGRGEDATGPRPQVFSVALDQIDADGCQVRAIRALVEPRRSPLR